MGNESSCCCYDDSVVSLDHGTSNDGSSNKRTPPHGPRINPDVVRTDAGTHMPSLMPTTLTTAQQRRRREEADEYEYEDITVMIGHHVSPKPPANNCGAKSHNTSATSSSLQHDGFLSRRNPMSSRRPSSSAGGPTTSDMAGFSFTTSHNLSSDATRPQSSQSDIPSSPDPGSRSREECGEDNESGPQPAASSPRVSRPVVGSSSQPPQLVMHRSGVPLTAVTAEFGFSLVPVNLFFLLKIPRGMR
ncbi:transmembrane protein, putative [Bodo saltans]|uniref:Transmembrane protein, putative n=1 Tax=Bodo saltans TaxID=75058 RepID=A0A0S4JNU5_BODSA|nr:transmembrane protein, putative [Bodo saltans]|eukprot:CUG91586.1 transmembrane protein, putative [Bodo saltans]